MNSLKLLIRLTALAETLMLTGCLVTQDEVVPAAHRKPYFGQVFRITLETDKERPQEWHWSSSENGYKSGSQAVQVVPAELVLESCRSKRGLCADDFVVVWRERPNASFSTVMLLHKYKGEKSKINGSLFVFDAEYLVNAVIRYDCLHEKDPKKCIADRFDKNSNNSLGVELIASPEHYREKIFDKSLFLDAITKPQGNIASWIMASPGKWNSFISYALSHTMHGNIYSLDNRGGALPTRKIDFSLEMKS